MSNKKIYSKPGLFGSTLHYDSNGKYIGKSSLGLFGNTIHTDAEGNYAGKSSPGAFGGTKHFDANNRFVGSSGSSLLGGEIHTDATGRLVGRSVQGLGSTTVTKVMKPGKQLSDKPVTISDIPHQNKPVTTSDKQFLDKQAMKQRSGATPNKDKAVTATSAVIRNETLFIEKPEDIKIYDPNVVKNIFFSHKYSGSVEPDYIMELLSRVKYINKISFSVQVSWELACRLRLLHPRELYFIISLNDKPKRLEIPELEKLEIYAKDASREVNLFNSNLLHTVSYDFTGVPNIKYLNLHWWEHLDYFCISQLRKLETLVIHDNTLFDLYWLSPKYRLKKFCCFAKLNDITAISMQTHLEYIDLNRNRIVDASPLLHLSGLKYLDLYMNPLINEDEIRKMDIESLIITWDEHETHLSQK